MADEIRRQADDLLRESLVKLAELDRDAAAKLVKAFAAYVDARMLAAAIDKRF